jgi:2-aminoethylphosphonate dioxygenase
MKIDNLKNEFKVKGIIKINSCFKKNKLKQIKNNIKKLKNEKKNIKIMKYFEPSIINYKNDILIRIENFYDYSDFFRKLIDSKKLTNILKNLTGKKWILFKEKINFKPRGSRADKLHQDIQSGWSKYAKNFISILISIDNSQYNNGCLEFDISGNNKDNLKGKLLVPLKIKDLTKPFFKKFALMPGDIVVFNGFIPHRSKKNLSHKPRTQVYLTFFSDKILKQNIRKKYFNDKRASYPPNSERIKNKKYIYKV